MPRYAQVIVDITSGSLDKTFQYRIPKELAAQILPGTAVMVPFGRRNRLVHAYVLELTDISFCEEYKIKTIDSMANGTLAIEGQMIQLAVWMKKTYGVSMIQALKTVMPVAKAVKEVSHRIIYPAVPIQQLQEILAECRQKNQKARVRLLSALVQDLQVPYDIACHKLHLTAASIRPLVQKGWIRIETKQIYRNPIAKQEAITSPLLLNEQQKRTVHSLIDAWNKETRGTCLVHGITGSGKTEVYMEIIAHVIACGKQAIVLIPEIALTYQTVMRFYHRFGTQVSFINSRLSQGERYDQFQRAKNKEVSIMIGPRSALFTPFVNLGLIIIDEEHESAYKSEMAPRYHATEVAKARAKLCGAMVVLGSATPLVASYQKAVSGEYQLLTMDKRAKPDSVLPKVHVVDLRKEMEAGNRSIFSRLLYEKIKERLARKEQILLFMNRRGYANFVSCRSCGEAVKCPHCDVSLTAHRNGSLHCHYCGYHIQTPRNCPSCGSPYIAGFGTGTQKVEAQLEKVFPTARILRMDMDTTRGKDGHEKIVRAFANEEADILIGTQMIVKGHDFEKVTLVGVLAADMSLFGSDYRATERTFQLLTQAAGRAGRGELAGEVVIQTYKPEHYSIQAAALQDYRAFYKEEVRYRKMMHYPPFWQMRVIQLSSPSQKNVAALADALAAYLRQDMIQNKLIVLGPSDPPVARINDIYYKKIYLKHSSEEFLLHQIEEVQKFLDTTPLKKDVLFMFDVV